MTPRALCLALIAMLPAASAAEEIEFRPLFNGRDLSGWVNVNCHPTTFQVHDGVIVCSGVPMGVLRTEEQYENFILELEWMHVHPQGNAGLFVWSDDITARGQPFTRSIEVQIMDGNHGDVFAIQGARMTPDRPHPRGWMRALPTEERAHPAGEWNHYRVHCEDGRITLAVNGAVVSSGGEASPRKGYICLESEGSEVHFRNIRIHELPSTNPPPEDVAIADRGFRSLYNGQDLDGWQADPGHEGHWVPTDWRLRYDGRSQAADPNLWTEESFTDFELIVDWRWTGEPEQVTRPVILPSGEQAVDEEGNPQSVEVLDAGDSGIYLRGSSKAQVNIWCWPVGSGEIWGYRTDAAMPAEVRRGATPLTQADAPIGRWNRFEITVRGEHVTVVLNGETVIDNAHLPGIPPGGPIALQHHGDPIEFANIYIRELDGPQ